MYLLDLSNRAVSSSASLTTVLLCTNTHADIFASLSTRVYSTEVE